MPFGQKRLVRHRTPDSAGQPFSLDALTIVGTSVPLAAERSELAE